MSYILLHDHLHLQAIIFVVYFSSQVTNEYLDLMLMNPCLPIGFAPKFVWLLPKLKLVSLLQLVLPRKVQPFYWMRLFPVLFKEYTKKDFQGE